MTYKPQQIANYFLNRAEDEGIPLTPLKLIKLIYIAYGWVLALTRKKLFNEPIEAWQHGPVIPSIYHEFKHYRGGPIRERAGLWNMQNNSYDEPEIPKSDKTTKLILDKVWAAYKHFSGWTLREKTHELGTPWKKVYDGTRGKEIPDEIISPYFHEKIRSIVDAAKSSGQS